MSENGIKITDFHAHILPAMDDGSRSPEESIKMLKQLRLKGVERVVATPHFYPKQEDPDCFLKRRAESCLMLSSAIKFAELSDGEIPEICIGAEVAYYSGMSLSRRIKELCIKGTNVMLLEMPFCKWTDSVVGEVCKMQREMGIQIVLAHVDRYFNFFDKATLFQLKTNRVMLQVNSDPFLRFFSGRRVLKLVQMARVDVLGSDMHNLESRPANIDAAMRVIKEKGYDSRLKKMMSTADALLCDAYGLSDVSN
jgi:protein-tyrosine phosphatase